jgi:Lipid A 3-O-deacylase (PagL)
MHRSHFVGFSTGPCQSMPTERDSSFGREPGLSAPLWHLEMSNALAVGERQSILSAGDVEQAMIDMEQIVAQAVDIDRQPRCFRSGWPRLSIRAFPWAEERQVMRTIGQFSCLAQLATLILLLLFPAAPAIGQLPPEGDRAWDISVWTAAATGEETQNSFAQSQIWTGGLYLGKVISDEVGTGWRRFALQYGFDLVPLFVQSGNAKILGGGFDPVILRFNSSYQIGRVRPYIELAGGAVLTTSNLPPGNTSSFNFTVRGGGGVYIRFKKRQAWDLGCRYFHISNANLANRNPEFNGVQVSLGYHWFK